MNQHVHPASHQNSALRVDFFYIPMPNKVPYLKSALTYAGQIELLKSRGLLIEDEIKAEHLLKNISYYRLSGYWYPMLADPKSAHRFKSGATFNNAFKLYCFDREFRQLVLSELEKIEVAIRAKMIYILSHNHGPFWFNEFPLFTDRNKLKSSKGKMLIEYNRSDEEFVKAFKRKYSEPLPPSWMILEISSFGILSNLFSNLKPGRNKREIASYFGLDDTTFESWLHTFTYIRNVCAHHARLWNKTFSISPKLPRTPRHQFLNTTSIIHPTNGTTIYLNKKTYYLCSILIYILNTINPKHNFQKKLNRLFDKYSNIDTMAMGFPKNWEQEPLWGWRNELS